MHGGTAWVYDGVVTWMGIVGALKGFNMRGLAFWLGTCMVDRR
jgi:hypothetical protein